MPIQFSLLQQLLTHNLIHEATNRSEIHMKNGEFVTTIRLQSVFGVNFTSSRKPGK